MSGTTANPRVTGIPDSGYPAEIEASLKVRQIDDLFDTLSDYDVPFLKLIGGIEPKFEITNTKYEWGEHDRYNRRAAIDNNPLLVGGTTLSLSTNRAHQFPRGTILKIGDELVWVSAQVDADDLTIVRGYAGTTAAQHETGAEVVVAGFAEVEGADVTVRHTPISSTFYNYPTILKTGLSVTWMQNVASVYGRKGNDMDELIANTTKELFVALNQAAISSLRDPGVGSGEPATMGGMEHFINSTDSNVTDLNGAAITEKDIMDLLQTIAYNVGQGNIPRTLVCGAWVKRKIGSFHQAERRMTSKENSVGMVVNSIETDFGNIDFIMDLSVPKDRLYLIHPENFEIGAFAGPHGRLAEYDLATQGDVIKKMLFGVYGMKVKRPLTMGKIIDISTTS